MVKKQIIIIAILGAIFIGLISIYFVLVRPLVNETGPETTAEPIDTEEWEDVGIGKKILAYDYIKSDDVQSITVNNEHGTYRIYRGEDDEAVIEGFEGIAFNKENMAALMSSVGYVAVTTKFDEPNALEEYGLAPTKLEDGTIKNPATFEVVTTSGEKYKGIVGDKIVTGNGYYFLYEKHPDVVYIVKPDFDETVLAPVEALIEPMIVTPLQESDYVKVHDFLLMKDKEVIVNFDYIEEADRANSEYVNQMYKMLSPEGLIPSSSAISGIMYKLYSSKASLEVVKLGINDEALAEYNLDKNAYSLYFKYNGVENLILISQRTSDGSFYAASPLFDQIVKGTSELFDFVTWDLFDWVESPFFQRNIIYITDISVESSDFNVTFELEGEGSALVVTDSKTGKVFDTNNFRQFYKTLLYSSYEGESNLTSDELETYHNMGDSEAQVVLTINTVGGNTFRYRFFQYTERRSYVELNGVGQFYTLSTVPKKILADAKRVVNNEPITSTGKY
ncbi:MAG: hypothetical protein IKT56_03925 [Clostridia bacterium]|nr:hypothetical protein [Clostridia bacterium]